MTGVVYLLHFNEPLHHARHYIGYCQSYEGLETRFAHHANGNGSKLLRAVHGKWQLARLWQGSRDDERRLKKRKEAPALCPLCTTVPRPVRGLTPIAL